MTQTSTTHAPPAPESARPDLDAGRRRRRRRLLLWSAPLMVLALLVAGALGWIAFANHLGRADVVSGAPGAAAERFDAQKPWTERGIEPWKAWYNTGTAYVLANEPFRATEELVVALELVPPAPAKENGALDPESAECLVRTNMSLAYEALGDQAMAAGDAAMARTYYDEGLGHLGPCTSDGRSEPPEDGRGAPPRSQQDEDERRQQDKSERAQEESESSSGGEGQSGQDDAAPDGEGQENGQGQGDEPGDDGAQDGQDGGEQPQDEPGDGEDGQGGADEEGAQGGDPRLEDLLDRNLDAERDREEQRQRGEGGVGGGQSW